MAVNHRQLIDHFNSLGTSLAREQAAAFDEDRARRIARRTERRSWLMPLFRN